jgi:hypothetical protein
LGPGAGLSGGKGKAARPETNLSVGALAERKNREIGTPIWSVEDDSIVEMEAVLGCILSSMTTTNRIHSEKAPRTKETNGCGGNEIAGKFNLNHVDMNVKDPPSDETFTLDSVCR